MVNKIVFNVLQVLVVMAFAPLIKGILTRLKENVQSKKGPSIFQPYYIWKCFSKDEVDLGGEFLIFRFTFIVFVTPIFVALLILVLTGYLFLCSLWGYAGRRVILALGVLRHPGGGGRRNFTPVGASLHPPVGFLAEPVFGSSFTVSFVAGSTIPYIVHKH